MPKQWNSVWAGREAFTSIDGKGYRHGSLDYVYLRLHRVVWALHYGEWPAGEVDHIDGNRLNNSIGNLRMVSASENHRNQKRSINNTSGHLGVCWHKPTSKWKVCLNHKGRQKHIGYYNTLEAAVEARRAANIKYGYHTNHGRN